MVSETPLRFALREIFPAPCSQEQWQADLLAALDCGTDPSSQPSLCPPAGSKRESPHRQTGSSTPR
jgi:hypothetical protein